jgi:hypothetical protein
MPTVAPTRPNAHPGLSESDRLLERLKSQYAAAQQVKFLHLQAEAETLFQQLQTLRQQDRSQCD